MTTLAPAPVAPAGLLGRAFSLRASAFVSDDSGIPVPPAAGNAAIRGLSARVVASTRLKSGADPARGGNVDIST